MDADDLNNGVPAGDQDSPSPTNRERWLAWRRNLGITNPLASWNEERAKREMAANMVNAASAAAQLTRWKDEHTKLELELEAAMETAASAAARADAALARAEALRLAAKQAARRAIAKATGMAAPRLSDLSSTRLNRKLSANIWEESSSSGMRAQAAKASGLVCWYCAKKNHHRMECRTLAKDTLNGTVQADRAGPGRAGGLSNRGKQQTSGQTKKNPCSAHSCSHYDEVPGREAGSDASED